MLRLVRSRLQRQVVSCEGLHVDCIGIDQRLNSLDDVLDQSVNHARRARFTYDDSQDLDSVFIFWQRATLESVDIRDGTVKDLLVRNDPSLDSHESRD